MEICRLTDLGAIRAAGADVPRFLSGQLSNDGERPMAPLAGWHDPRGRVRAIVRLLPAGGDSTLLLAERELVEPVLKGLGMFVLRDDVKLTDQTGAVHLTGLRVEAGQPPPAGLPGWPEAVDAALEADGITVVRVPDPDPARQRFVVASPAPFAAPGATEMKTGQWRLLDIRCGLSRPGAASSGQHVAQMLNLDLVGAVSFSTGCYVGQEIIARAHHLGRVKRRMFRFGVAGGSVPQEGERVLRTDTAEPCGTVVTAAPAAGDGHELLAVMHLDALDAPLALADGGALQRLALPYDVG